MGLFNNGKGLTKNDEKLFYRFIEPHLQKGEQVELFIANTINRTRYGLNHIPSQFVSATNKRVIYLEQQGVMKSEIKSFPYEQIRNIDMKMGPLFSEVEFYVTNNEFSIKNIAKNNARDFVEFIESKRA